MLTSTTRCDSAYLWMFCPSMESMENSKTKLTELQFWILDGMADDCEDIEQLYLYANRRFSEERQRNIQFPLTLVQVRFPLRDMLDEIVNMHRQEYIEALISNDEQIAPLRPLNLAALHHYWFRATNKGVEAWKVYPVNKLHDTR